MPPSTPISCKATPALLHLCTGRYAQRQGDANRDGPGCHFQVPVSFSFFHALSLKVPLPLSDTSRQLTQTSNAPVPHYPGDTSLLVCISASSVLFSSIVVCLFIHFVPPLPPKRHFRVTQPFVQRRFDRSQWIASLSLCFCICCTYLFVSACCVALSCVMLS